MRLNDDQAGPGFGQLPVCVPQGAGPLTRPFKSEEKICAVMTNTAAREVQTLESSFPVEWPSILFVGRLLHDGDRADTAGDLGKDSHLAVNRANQFAQGWQLRSKEQRACNAERTARHQRILSANARGHGASDQTAKWSDTLKRDRVKTRDTSAFLIFCNDGCNS